MDTFACLYIVRGEPFRPGTCLNISMPETVFGRTSAGFSPDFSFSNAFISRNHFVIRRENDAAVLYDSGSPNGTEINGQKVVPHTPYRLQTGDIIKLAKGLTVIHFSYLFGEQTLELEPLSSAMWEEPSGATTIHWEKRECVVGGKPIAMSEKEYLFLDLMYKHANQLVTYHDIKQTVWPDRPLGPGGAPDVHTDELNALIYRIRKKYKNTFLISAVRGNGYILETDAKESAK
ncbi:FHA domain-containing protein [Paenibacillus ginsengarvi]|uniref:FHA domain-containing protein n=2 Tax=Paenibacillus ginsengarvi TaxID=400777 RepID=A0A3B0CDY3_9BACL|nr:FHA domain-containing protein [Paenibacillus ginsengarvi]